MGAAALDMSCVALSSTNPRKGAQPVPGPTSTRGIDAGGGGREPLRNHAGIYTPAHSNKCYCITGDIDCSIGKFQLHYVYTYHLVDQVQPAK